MVNMNKQLKKETLEFIRKNSFKELTNVQNEVFNYTSSNKDIVTIAKTGTGKTHAYLIPVMEKINPKSDKTQVLISLPTRELAHQVYENACVMKEVYQDLRISLLAGGTDAKKSSSKLTKAPQIVIGTPGRIRDFFESNIVRVDFVQMFIIDEADMTLDYGFLEDIDVVFSRMVKNPEVLCFSATFSNELKLFVRKYLNNPKIIEINDKKRDPQIKHILVPCKHLDYKEALIKLLPGFKPFVCLIFANSKEYAEETYEYLKDYGFKVLLIHGGLESRERQKAIKALTRNEYKYVICSDVASRGIDIASVSHVVSMGFPKQLEFYVHRAGRTGRNGQSGTCFALFKEDDIPSIKTLNVSNGINFTAEELKNGVWKKTKNPIAKRISKQDQEVIEIAKTLYRKNEKVKPNYKKKKAREIEKIRRKKRRDYIKGKIKEERTERYKQQTRAKKGY